MSTKQGSSDEKNSETLSRAVRERKMEMGEYGEALDDLLILLIQYPFSLLGPSLCSQTLRRT